MSVHVCVVACCHVVSISVRRCVTLVVVVNAGSIVSHCTLVLLTVCLCQVMKN